MEIDTEVYPEWIVYNLFVSSPTLFQEIVSSFKSFAEKLIESGDLVGFYYNLYNIPPKVLPHIRFGFYKLRDETAIKEKIEKLKRQGKITKVKLTKPDLTDVDGVVMDKIKLTARKITQLITNDFERITKTQATYLIHLSMNPLFGYVDEREIYLNCVASVEKAIRDHHLLPKEKWLPIFGMMKPETPSRQLTQSETALWAEN